MSDIVASSHDNFFFSGQCSVKIAKESGQG